MYKNIADMLYVNSFNDAAVRRAALRSSLWPAAQAVCLRMLEKVPDTPLYVLRHVIPANNHLWHSSKWLGYSEAMVIGPKWGDPMFCVYRTEYDSKYYLRMTDAGNVSPFTAKGVNGYSTYTVMLEAASIKYFINAINNDRASTKKQSLPDRMAGRVPSSLARVTSPMCVEIASKLRSVVSANGLMTRSLTTLFTNSSGPGLEILNCFVRGAGNPLSVEAQNMLRSIIGDRPQQWDKALRDTEDMLVGNRFIVGYAPNFGYMVFQMDTTPWIAAAKSYADEGYKTAALEQCMIDSARPFMNDTSFYPTYDDMPGDMGRQVMSALAFAKQNIADNSFYASDDPLIHTGAAYQPAIGYMTMPVLDMYWSVLIP